MKPTLTPIAAALLCGGASALAQTAAVTQVEVRGQAPATYVLPSTAAGTRTDTPIEQLPQSVISLPRSLIEDQDLHTVDAALRNVSNVSPLDPRDSVIAGFKVRGFGAAMVVDGVSMPGYFQNMESLVNVERIDVVKGPSGGLFGSGQGIGTYGSQGGTIALTTLAPEAAPLRSIGLRLGSFAERGLNLDVNQPLGEGWSARVTGEWSRSDSETDGVFFKRLAVFPSLAWSPDARTRVVLRLRHVDNRTLDYAGLPVDGTLDTSTFTLPRSFNLTATGLPETTQSSDGANLQWTQALDERWTFGLTAAWNQVKVDERGVFPMPFGGAGPVQALFGARLWNDWRTTTLSPSLTGKLDWAGTRHTLSLGLDHERTTDDAYMAFSVGPGFFGDLGMVDLTNPSMPAWVEPQAPNPPDQRNRYTANVAYVQDQVDIGPWHLLGGLRYSRISITDVNSSPLFGQNNVSKNSKATPRVGAVFDISPAVSVFAGYSEGIKVPTGSLFATPPKPESSVQKEIGLRLKDLGGVSATLAVFDLTRRNAPITDPATFLSVQTGEQRAKGVDLDLRWQATSALSLLAAFTSQTARITEHAFDPTLVDKRLFNVPEQQWRLAARYDIRQGDLAGLGLGLGVTSRGQLPLDNANSRFTPATTVWDAQLSYRVGVGRYGVSVQNLLDKRYWQPAAYFGGGQVLPALPRSVSATAQFSF